MDRPENEVGKDQDESDPADNNIGGDNKRPSPESNSGIDERSTPKKARTQRRIFTPFEKGLANLYHTNKPKPRIRNQLG